MKRKQTIKNNTEPVLVLGIGNILMGDEGIGCHVAQFLLQEGLPEGVVCMDGGTGGMHLLEALQTARDVVLVDATLNNKMPGAIQRLEPRFSKDYPRTLTAHDIGLKDMLDAMYLLGKTPNIILYAVTVTDIDGVSTLLSPKMEKLVPVIAQKVRLEIESLLHR